MKENTFYNNPNDRTAEPDEVLKVTALCYLDDALSNEQYEVCRDLIAKAKELGVKQKEVRAVLRKRVKSIKGGKPGGVFKANIKGNRLRF